MRLLEYIRVRILTRGIKKSSAENLNNHSSRKWNNKPSMSSPANNWKTEQEI